MKNIDISPLEISFSGDGVEDFYYPIASNLQDSISFDLAVELVELVNIGDINSDIGDEVLWLSIAYIVIDVTNIIYHKHLLETAKADGVNLVRTSDGVDSLKSYRSSEGIRSQFVGKYGKALKDQSAFRNYLRWIVSAVAKRDKFSRVVPSFINREKDILCFNGDSTMCEFARRTGRRLVLGTYPQWFGEVRVYVPEELKHKFDGILSKVLSRIYVISKALEIHVSDDTIAGIKSAIVGILQLTYSHLMQVSKMSYRFPQELWLGSAGNLYNRMIARAAQKVGARVVCFDHGSGSGWVDVPLVRLIDVDFCDEFHTFTDRQAYGIEQLARPELRVAKAIKPKVVASSFPLFQPPLRTLFSSGKRRPRAMYVPSLYENGITSVPPLIPEVVALDFQAKLLCELNGLGYDVVIKPHPECRIGVPERLIEFTGAKIENAQFEEVCSQANLLIFDYLTTSAIRSAFYTKVPMLLVDHGRVPIAESALPTLSKRASFLNIECNEKNRPVLSVNELKCKIDEAKHKVGDVSFRNSYFGE